MGFVDSERNGPKFGVHWLRALLGAATLHTFRVVLSGTLLILALCSGSAAGQTTGSGEPATRSPAPDVSLSLMGSSGLRLSSSAWYEAERRQFRQLLSHQHADVLIVPFESQHYGVDRIERALMTHYLADAVASRSDATVADLTLVGKALGETQRRFSDVQVLSLANDIGAEMIVRGYVGHLRDQRMVLTVQVLRRPAGGGFSRETPISTYEWADLAFADEYLPSEVFREMLGDVTARLPVMLRRAPPLLRIPLKKHIDLPSSPLALAKKDGGLDPVDAAYRLQLLGALYPEDVEHGKEQLFVRSLAALTRVDPRSPDYALLRARAFHYLKKRPAAIKALENARKSDVRELRAMINGDLYELEKEASRLSSPLHASLAAIALFDLRWTYGVLPYLQVDWGAVGGADFAWRELTLRRLRDRDHWAQQSSLVVKRLLDDFFPGKGAGAADIFASLAMLPPLDARERVAQSVYHHVRGVLDDSSAEQWVDPHFTYLPKPMDMLFLLDSIGISNALREVYFELFVQGAEDRAMLLIERYARAYGGHPLFDSYHAHALLTVASKRGGAAKDRLEAEGHAIALRAYFFAGGQTGASMRAVGLLVTKQLLVPLYNGDFPRRSYWPLALRDVDRPIRDRDLEYGHIIANAEVALAYESERFDVLVSLYGSLDRAGDEKSMADLLKESEGRFRGHPDRIPFLAGLRRSAGDDEGEHKLYERGLLDEPFNWNNYLALGIIHAYGGDYKRAADVFLSFPLFTDPDIPNKVGLSQWAHAAGMSLYAIGGIDESMPLFRMSADYQTGSGAGLHSAAIVAQEDGRLGEAAEAYRVLFTRYNDPTGLNGYVSLLYAFGYAELADSILRGVKERIPLYAMQDAMLTGMRVAKKTGALDVHRTMLTDVTKFAGGGRGHDEGIAAAHAALRLFDAKPSPEVVAELDALYELPTLRLGDGGRVERLNPDPRQQNWYRSGPDELLGPAAVDVSLLTHAKSDLSYFVEAYIEALDRNWEKAASALERRGHYYSNLRARYAYALPLTARILLKNGDRDTLESYWAEHKADHPNLNGYIVQALLDAEHGKTADAVSVLRQAARSAQPASTIFGERYTLVEAVEWLYEDSGHDDYRRLMLELARTHQRAKPTIAWAYAIEAVYGDSEETRLRAIGLTMHLDPDSRRLALIPEEDKERARHWLEKNNPFVERMNALSLGT